MMFHLVFFFVCFYPTEMLQHEMTSFESGPTFLLFLVTNAMIKNNLSHVFSSYWFSMKCFVQMYFTNKC